MRIRELSEHELSLARIEIEKREKNATVAWLLWLFLGGIGGHRYYLGPTWQAVLMTLTIGGLGVWTLIDAFMIPGRLRALRSSLEEEVATEILAERSYRERVPGSPAKQIQS